MSSEAAPRDALRRASEATGRLLTSLPGATVAIPGSLWNAREVGGHLVFSLRALTDIARGHDPGITDVSDTGTFHDRVAAVNARAVALEPPRDLTVLAELVVDSARGFLDATGGTPGSDLLDIPWYGAALDVETATCLLLGEQLVHGYDVARAVDARWPIAPEDARLVIRGARSLLPLMVDPDAARGLHAGYGIRVRGGERFTVRVSGGTVRVEGDGGRVDCHLSADPVALLLVGYGRISQWRAIRSGKLLAWGRKPWLALRFKGLFVDP